MGNRFLPCCRCCMRLCWRRAGQRGSVSARQRPGSRAPPIALRPAWRCTGPYRLCPQTKAMSRCGWRWLANRWPYRSRTKSWTNCWSTTTRCPSAILSVASGLWRDNCNARRAVRYAIVRGACCSTRIRRPAHASKLSNCSMRIWSPCCGLVPRQPAPKSGNGWRTDTATPRRRQAPRFAPLCTCGWTPMPSMGWRCLMRSSEAQWATRLAGRRWFITSK